MLRKVEKQILFPKKTRGRKPKRLLFPIPDHNFREQLDSEPIQPKDDNHILCFEESHDGFFCRLCPYRIEGKSEKNMTKLHLHAKMCHPDHFTDQESFLSVKDKNNCEQNDEEEENLARQLKIFANSFENRAIMEAILGQKLMKPCLQLTQRLQVNLEVEKWADLMEENFIE